MCFSVFRFASLHTGAPETVSHLENSKTEKIDQKEVTGTIAKHSCVVLCVFRRFQSNPPPQAPGVWRDAKRNPLSDSTKVCIHAVLKPQEDINPCVSTGYAPEALRD